MSVWIFHLCFFPNVFRNNDKNLLKYVKFKNERMGFGMYLLWQPSLWVCGTRIDCRVEVAVLVNTANALYLHSWETCIRRSKGYKYTNWDHKDLFLWQGTAGKTFVKLYWKRNRRRRFQIRPRAFYNFPSVDAPYALLVIYRWKLLI